VSPQEIIEAECTGWRKSSSSEETPLLLDAFPIRGIGTKPEWVMRTPIDTWASMPLDLKDLRVKSDAEMAVSRKLWL
jgi:hypothetical protein